MDAFIYPWQESIWQAWQTLLAQDRLHHAILYSAPKGSGSLPLLANLAKTLLCTQNKTEPCEHCHSCQLFNAGNHPDFHYLKPEVEGKQLGVDVIRSGNKFAWQTSQLGGVRVILLSSADHMGDAAANALLKTLEEPPENCHFILLANSVEKMLPTIISRCNKWKSNALNEEQIYSWLNSSLDRSLTTQIINMHFAAPLAAKAFIDENKIANLQNLIKAFVQYVVFKKELFTLVDLIVKEQENTLTWLTILLLDTLKIKHQVHDKVVFCHELALIEPLSNQSEPILINQLKALNQLKAQLTLPNGLNSELLITHWLTSFHSLEAFSC